MKDQDLLAKKEVIERLRKELYSLFQEEGKITNNLIKKSKELDALIYQYQREALLKYKRCAQKQKRHSTVEKAECLSN